MYTDRRVAGTGTARHKADARAPGQLAVRLRHEGRTTLLPVDDELDLIAVTVKSIQHRQIAFARYAKGMCDTLFNKALNQQVASDLGSLSSSHVQHCADNVPCQIQAVTVIDANCK